MSAARACLPREAAAHQPEAQRMAEVSAHTYRGPYLSARDLRLIMSCVILGLQAGISKHGEREREGERRKTCSFLAWPSLQRERKNV